MHRERESVSVALLLETHEHPDGFELGHVIPPEVATLQSSALSADPSIRLVVVARADNSGRVAADPDAEMVARICELNRFGNPNGLRKCTPPAIESIAKRLRVNRADLIRARDAVVPLGSKIGTAWDVAHAALFLRASDFRLRLQPFPLTRRRAKAERRASAAKKPE
jgi:hypothetical protein